MKRAEAQIVDTGFFQSNIIRNHIQYNRSFTDFPDFFIRNHHKLYPKKNQPAHGRVLDAPRAETSVSFLFPALEPACHHDRISRPQKRKGRALADFSTYERTFAGTGPAVPSERSMHSISPPCNTPSKTPPIRLRLLIKTILSRAVNKYPKRKKTRTSARKTNPKEMRRVTVW